MLNNELIKHPLGSIVLLFSPCSPDCDQSVHTSTHYRLVLLAVFLISVCLSTSMSVHDCGWMNDLLQIILCTKPVCCGSINYKGYLVNPGA